MPNDFYVPKVKRHKTIYKFGEAQCKVYVLFKVKVQNRVKTKGEVTNYNVFRLAIHVAVLVRIKLLIANCSHTYLKK